jgi:hypothetical protein
MKVFHKHTFSELVEDPTLIGEELYYAFMKCYMQYIDEDIKECKNERNSKALGKKIRKLQVKKRS